MRNPINEMDNESLKMIFEEIDENSIHGGSFPNLWTIAKLSPISKKLGNHGAVCTGTIECQSNCK